MSSEFDPPLSPPPPSPIPPAPAYAPAPASLQSTDKVLVILCHLSAAIGVGVGFLLPFIVWLVKKDEDARVAAHAKEALNFHISLLIYAVCCVPLIFVVVGIFLLIGLAIASLVMAIMAALRAAEGGFYRYPLTLRVIS